MEKTVRGRRRRAPPASRGGAASPACICLLKNNDPVLLRGGTNRRKVSAGVLDPRGSTHRGAKSSNIPGGLDYTRGAQWHPPNASTAQQLTTAHSEDQDAGRRQHRARPRKTNLTGTPRSQEEQPAAAGRRPGGSEHRWGAWRDATHAATQEEWRTAGTATAWRRRGARVRRAHRWRGRGEEGEEEHPRDSHRHRAGETSGRPPPPRMSRRPASEPRQARRPNAAATNS